MPTSAPEVAIELDNVTAGYRSTTVVRGVSLRVGRGELVCVLGANGVGKTTLLRSILGLLKVTSGAIALGGDQIHRKSPHAIARLGVGFVPEGRGLIPDLSVRDNLLLGTVRWNRRFRSAAVTAALDDVYEHFPILGQRARQRAGWLSGGEQQMLAIGRALVSRPSVLVLDEPTLGLAPLIVRQVFDDLARVRERGIAVLVAEQNASAALRLATSAYVMKSGRIVSHGTASEIRASGALRAAYLGEGA
jgi:branched-chain amino acid transport system ATP-binding protein